MAKWTMHGLDKYARYLQKIGANTPEIIGAGVYEMARIVADQVRANLEALPSVPDKANISNYKKGYTELSRSEKQGMLDGLGISHMENKNGYYNVKVGFDGYNSVKTKKYPNGQPNALMARIAESGSRYRQKTPFVRPAVRQSEQKALHSAMIKIDERIFAIK